MRRRTFLVVACVLALTGCAGEGTDGKRAAARPSPSTQEDQPILSLDPGVARPGQVISLSIHGPEGYIYGNDAYVEIEENGAWRRLYLLNTGRLGGGRYLELDEKGQLPPGIARTLEGYSGDLVVQITVPPLEPGIYRIAKDFIADREGTIEERTALAATTLTIEAH